MKDAPVNLIVSPIGIRVTAPCVRRTGKTIMVLHGMKIHALMQL